MRHDLAQGVEGHTGCGDERMPNAQGDFANDGDVVLQEKVVVVRDGAVQAVFNRQHGSLCGGCGGGVIRGGKLLKDLCREGAGNERLRAEQRLNCQVAVGAGFTLDGDAHDRVSFSRRA